MAHESFATAINCMDGRTQDPVNKWLKKTMGVRYVDVITEPGPDKVLVHGDRNEIGAIKRKVMISANAHGSRCVAIVAHHDCAGNPVSKQEHLRMVDEAVKVVKSWDLPLKVIGLWVNENWDVEVLTSTQDR